MNDETPAGTILSRIRTAAGLFSSGNKMKYQAIADLYAIYLEAKADPAVAAEIESQYSAEGFPKTDLLTNKVLWLGFEDGVARQRISDMHQLLLECEKQGKAPADLVDWFTSQGGWRKVLAEAAGSSDPKKTKRTSSKSSGDSGSGSESNHMELPDPRKLFDALDAFNAEARFQSSSNLPPIPVGIEVGEFLVQICRKTSADSFLTYWAKLTEKELEHIQLSTLAAPLSQAA